MEQVLAIPPFANARPEVLSDATRLVSWVHSSEIYEIAPLLDGGEVLLTTGLGLVGSHDEELVSYVEGIASRGATALVLELGRTFVDVPSPMVAAARRDGLGLVALHAVVPFVRIARAANELILDHEASGLRRVAAAARELTDLVARRAGTGAIVDALQGHAAAPVVLVDEDGRVHAGTRPDPPTIRVAVEHHGAVWGQLVAHDDGDPFLVTLLEHGADALRLLLLDVGVAKQADPRRALLIDLLRASMVDREHVGRRAATLRLRVDLPVAAVVVVPGRGTRGSSMLADVRQALARVVRVDLITHADDNVVAVVDAVAAQRTGAERMLAALDEVLDAARPMHVAVGPAVARLDQVPTSFDAAFGALDTARELGLRRRLLLPADLAVHRFLLDSDDAALERLVTRTLGPLLEHDAAHRSPLLPTLTTYLAHGRSKSAAAGRLGVRRQTIHERLERIGDMLDARMDDEAAMTVLEVAALAWQVRTSGGGER